MWLFGGYPHSDNPVYQDLARSGAPFCLTKNQIVIKAKIAHSMLANLR
jgi:hypothetical protein